MTRLNQILAIEKGARNDGVRALSDSYHLLQKPDPLSGINRTYRPKDDEGDELPSETKRVQVTVSDVLTQLRQPLERMLNVAATKDIANTEARADVVIGDRTIMTDVPPTYLLYLEKQLQDLLTFFSKLPVLDPGENWTWDDATSAYVSEPMTTHRSKKVKRSHVLFPATDKHPAQVQAYDEDEIVGYWKTTRYSGAIPKAEMQAYVKRVRELLEAVKKAREEANAYGPVTDSDYGEKVLDYVLFGD